MLKCAHHKNCEKNRNQLFENFDFRRWEQIIKKTKASCHWPSEDSFRKLRSKAIIYIQYDCEKPLRIFFFINYRRETDFFFYMGVKKTILVIIYLYIYESQVFLNIHSKSFKFSTNHLNRYWNYRHEKNDSWFQFKLRLNYLKYKTFIFGDHITFGNGGLESCIKILKWKMIYFLNWRNSSFASVTKHILSRCSICTMTRRARPFFQRTLMFVSIFVFFFSFLLHRHFEKLSFPSPSTNHAFFRWSHICSSVWRSRRMKWRSNGRWTVRIVSVLRKLALLTGTPWLLPFVFFRTLT